MSTDVIPWPAITHTRPMAHQERAIQRALNRPYFGHLMEQGTGKTFVTIVEIAWLFLRGSIDTALIFAPNGVHDNWAENELPKHLALQKSEYDVIVWHSTDGTKARRTFEWYLENRTPGKLLIVLANVEALRTKRFLDLMLRHVCKGADLFFPHVIRPVMMVIDEATTIKNPKAELTKVAIRLGEHMAYRRILTGTPISQGPLDLWAPCRFLHKEALPYRSWTGFKTEFAVEQTIRLGPNRPMFNKVVGYRQLDKLTREIAPFTERVLKKDCLDLPDKIYQTRYVELTPEQKKHYLELSKQCLTMLDNGQGFTAVTDALSMLLRLQQIALGYTVNQDGSMVSIPQLRTDTLKEIIEEASADSKFIIFCRFKEDVKRVSEAVDPHQGPLTVAYHGAVSDQGRMTAIERFQNDPTCRFFIATSAAARGLTLTAASHVIYYSQDFRLETRLQSEDRAHRIGQTKSVIYIDLIARKTVDQKIVAALQEKKNLADTVLDPAMLRSIIQESSVPDMV